MQVHLNFLSTYLYNGIDRTRLLAEPTIDALSHINVVSCRSPATVCPRLCLDCDGLCWTNGLTQLARDAPLLSIWVPPEGMLTTETWADGSFLERIVDGSWFTEKGTQGYSQATKQLSQEQCGGISIHDCFSIHSCFSYVNCDILCVYVSE